VLTDRLLPIEGGALTDVAVLPGSPVRTGFLPRTSLEGSSFTTADEANTDLALILGVRWNALGSDGRESVIISIG
jgi:hypothetical protein